MNKLEQKALEKEKLLMALYAAFDESRLFQNIPIERKQMMAEVAVSAFMPFVKEADKLAELSIETDLQALDAMTVLEKKVSEKEQEELADARKVILADVPSHLKYDH